MSLVMVKDKDLYLRWIRFLTRDNVKETPEIRTEAFFNTQNSIMPPFNY